MIRSTGRPLLVSTRDNGRADIARPGEAAGEKPETIIVETPGGPGANRIIIDSLEDNDGRLQHQDRFSVRAE